MATINLHSQHATFQTSVIMVCAPKRSQLNKLSISLCSVEIPGKIVTNFEKIFQFFIAFCKRICIHGLGFFWGGWFGFCVWLVVFFFHEVVRSFWNCFKTVSSSPLLFQVTGGCIDSF